MHAQRWRLAAVRHPVAVAHRAIFRAGILDGEVDVERAVDAAQLDRLLNLLARLRPRARVRGGTGERGCAAGQVSAEET
jgi:hypothetical protein